MNDIIFNRGRGGLGRALAGKDHISGIVANMKTEDIPAPLVALSLSTILYSVQDATDLGIVYSENADNMDLDALRYHIERVYDASPKAVVHLQIADRTENVTITDGLTLLQNKAKGEVKQALLISTNTDFAVADLSAIQAVCDNLEAEHKPLSVVYACNFVGLDIATFDVRALENKRVSVSCGMDGNAKGNELFEAYSKSFTDAGAVVGTLSAAKVHECIAWVGKFDLSKNDTNEFDVLRLADGRLLDEVSATELDAINSKGFIFLKKHFGKSGSYFNDSHTATSLSSDYAFIENNRVIDKAVTGTRTFLLPSLNSPLTVDEDGKLSEDTIASFKIEAERALEEMQRTGEVSAFEVLIDPDQNVLKTSKLAITIKIVPIGVARNIVVNIGLAVKVGG